MKPGPMEARRAVAITGQIEYRRTVFHCRKCRTTAAPLDEEMGVEKGMKFTRRVRRAIAFAAANSAFGDAAAAMKENFGLDISVGQSWEIANAEGERIDAATEEREEEWRSGERPPESSCETLVLLSDATAVLTRSGEEHKMVNLVRGYDLAARTANADTGEADQSVRPMLAESRYGGTAHEQASAGGAKSDLANRILAVGCRMGADTAKRIVFLADGSPVLWTICEELYPEAIQIQDYWHVLEYLSGAAKASAKTEEEAAELRKRWSHMLKESRLGEIQKEIAEKRKRVRSQEKRETLRKAIDYIENGRERMDYARFIEAGLPIGSGPIESACKHIVKERYNLSGARWSRAKTGNILALRLAIANEEWNEHWRKKPPKEVKAA